MKSQYIPILAISLLLGLFLISNVSAQALLVNPASSAVISGSSYIWNATNGTTPEFARIMNCTLYGKSVSTANSSYIPLSVATNVSAAAQLTMVNGTFNTLGLEDAADYTFFASCYNISNILQNSSVNTAIIISNGVPTAPVLSPVSNAALTSSSTQTFTGTVVDANTTSCTYAIGRGGTSSDSQDTVSGSASYSGSSCTFTKAFTSSSDNGIWSWYITASDGSNATSSQALFQVSLPAAGGGSGASSSFGTGSGSGGISIGAITASNINWKWIIGIIVVILLIVFIVRKK